MRIGEIVGLTWDRVDFERGFITIDRQLQARSGEYVFTSTKSGKSRTIAPASWVCNCYAITGSDRLKCN